MGEGNRLSGRYTGEGGYPLDASDYILQPLCLNSVPEPVPEPVPGT